MNISQTLHTYGLSENEISVYLALLKNNSRTAYSLAKETGIPRATVYTILESLSRQHLSTSFRKNNVLYFMAENPERFIENLNTKKEMIGEIIPSLRSLMNNSEFNPSVKLYTGKDGLRIVFEDIYDNPKEKGIHTYYTISHPELAEHLPKILPRFLKMKKDWKIFTFLIAPYFVSKLENPPSAYKDDEFREVRFLPENFPFQGTMILYGKKAAIFSMKDGEIYSVILESPVMTDMLKQFFLCTWELLKKK